MRWVVVASLIAAADAPMAGGQGRPGIRELGALLAEARCADQVLSSVRAESADFGPAIPDPPGPTGTRSLRMPSRMFGMWLRVTVEPDGAVMLERLSAESRQYVTYGADCRERVETQTPPRSLDTGGYTDARLAARLARGDAGVILLWSPHMPLSVDEYAVLEQAAAALDLALVSVLDPVADLDYARRVARERGMPESALTPLAGIELAFRGMTNHAPSLQVFAGGKLVGPVLHGYRDGVTVRAAITEILEGR